jgi:uncharacterized protein (TIGR03032 family)
MEDDVEAAEPSPPAQSPRSFEGIARGDFTAILDRLGLSLVLITRPAHVVFLGAADGQLTCTTLPLAQPSGLAVKGNRIAVASARTVMVFANTARLAAQYPGRRAYYDAFFVPRLMHFTGDAYMHDMVFAGDTIIAANTRFSCICRIDGKFSFSPLWRPSFISQLRAEDRCHLNGFAGKDGELRYVTALSATDTEAGWRAAPDSGGILIDVRRNAMLRSDLCMPHSPRIVDDRLYLLNGGEGELLHVDRVSGASTVLARLPGFTHGLCAHAGIFFVGLSQNRISRKDNPPPVACRDPGLIAGVAAIDGRSGHTLGTLEFTTGATEVYDVKALPGVRRAGMQDVLASDGYVGVETPGSVFWLKGPDIEAQHRASQSRAVIRST